MALWKLKVNEEEGERRNMTGEYWKGEGTSNHYSIHKNNITAVLCKKLASPLSAEYSELH